MKIPVCVRQYYVFYLELYENYLWFHTDIFKWSSSVKKNFIEDVNTLQSLLPLPLLALVTEDNKKLAKFAKLTGWKHMKNLILNDGSKASIFSWSK